MFFVGLGHSHVVALAKGAYALQAQGAMVAGETFACRFHYLYDARYEPPFISEGGELRLNRSIGEALRENDPRFILTSIGGNEHNVLSIAQRDRRFDFILGEEPNLPVDDRAELLPEAAVRETLRDWMKDKTDVLTAIRAATGAPIVQIEPPPPLPRAQVLAYPKEFFRSLLDQRNMSSDTLRYKMWRVQSELLREICAEAGIVYVRNPPDVIDSDGMLLRHACGKDATHANDSYGEAIVARALRCISDQFAKAG
jgi:hypothetical protein